MEAAQEGHYPVVKYLLDRGADIHRETQTGDTALSYACENGHVDVVELLIEKGAKPEHLSEGGRSPLMKACRGGHIDVIKFLLNKSADVNRQTASNDHTPLSLACAGGHISAVELLLARGANPYHKLKDNSTMIIEAARGGHTNVIRTLLDYSPQRPGDKNQAAKMQQGKGGNQAQAKSVLRKSRSASTLDSSAAAQQKTTEASGEPAKGKQPPPANASQESRKQPGPSGDGKATDPVAPDVRKKPAVVEAKPTVTTTTGQHQPPAATKKVVPAVAVCTDCAKNSAGGDGHGNVKRPANTSEPSSPNVTPVSPGGTGGSGSSNPSSPNAGGAALTSGPPLVPSQVTADTAISERPKAKANKPSARKVQLQQQQIKQQQQQGVAASPSCGEKAQLSPGPSPSSNSVGTAPNTPTSPPAVVGAPGPKPPMTPLLQLQLHQQHLITTYKGDKTSKDFEDQSELLGMSMGMDLAQVITGTTYSGTPGALATIGNLPLSGNAGSGPPGTTTTTTTTTVVVTHGNGETETIIEGDGLSLAGNEVLAASMAAGFNLECLPGGTIQVGPGGSGAVQVQSYQLSTPSDFGGIAGPVTASMHTHTTIINSGSGAFQSPLMLAQQPFSHPQLPSNLVPASVSSVNPPVPGSTPLQPPLTTMKTGPATQKSNAAPPPKPPLNLSNANAAINAKMQQAAAAAAAVSNVSTTPVGAVGLGVKKQTAKRSRPFGQQGPLPPPSGASSQGAHPRQSTQHTQTSEKSQGKGQSQSHSSAATQTPKSLDVDSATESNGETSLSIAAASGHYEVVEFLIARKAHIEHRDKKGCTPLILAADGGHEKVVELLLSHGAEIEAQSERTKDTALSLACTKGRYEVVELLLKRGANKEHRNVSDYTPLSLAASGGYVNIIKLLLQHGAEINSRTGSKLGISPLMLAAMNGNTAAVKLLLDMGSDINAQIETNKNTALTLACFQGRHEVVSLLLERKANLEHRAKTGLTPLMEAANGGYTEVGKVLIDRGADVNAPPVPATRDTALTIAADKGHYRFVELLITKGAIVDVRNKKGCTPLWLACHGGHLDVAQILFRHGADLDVQDNRRISCLMAAFRKGHVKVIRWIVKNVQQFPSDAETARYYLSLQSEPELLKRCQSCGEYIKSAKDKQALEANKNASILLEELDLEKSREESKRQAAARRREKKKKKKQEKRQQVSGGGDDDDDDEVPDDDEVDDEVPDIADSGIDANSQGSNSSNSADKDNGRRNNNNNNSKGKGNKENQHQIHQREPINIPVIPVDVQPIEVQQSKNRKKKNRGKHATDLNATTNVTETTVHQPTQPQKPEKELRTNTTNVSKSKSEKEILKEKIKEVDIPEPIQKKETSKKEERKIMKDSENNAKAAITPTNTAVSGSNKKKAVELSPEPLMGIALNPSQLRKSAFSDHDMTYSSTNTTPPKSASSTTSSSGTPSGPKTPASGRKDDGWKEVTRSCPSSRSKKVIVPSSVISRVIGRGGCNINAIREATGAHIEVEKQQKGQLQPERTIQIKGSADATKQAHNLITALMNEPDLDVKKLLPTRHSGSSLLPGIVGQPIMNTGSNVFSATNLTPTTFTNPSAPLHSIAAPMDIIAQAAVKPLVPTTAGVSKSTSGSGIPPLKSSPTPKILGTISPPLGVKTVSPPIKKPTPVAINNGQSNTYSTSAPSQNISTNSAAFKNSGSVGKQRSMVVTPSAAVTTSFAAKLTQPTQQPHGPQTSHFGPPRNVTPTPSNMNMNTSCNLGMKGTSNTPAQPGLITGITGSPTTPTPTPPPTSSSPIIQNTNSIAAMNGPHTQNLIQQQSTQQKVDRIPNAFADRQNQACTQQQGMLHNVVQNLNTSSLGPLSSAPGPVGGIIKNSDAAILRNHQNGPIGGLETYQTNRNLTGNNPGVVGSHRSTECIDGTSSTSQTPLEYSPFNYTFSKTAGWFPGDLAQPSGLRGDQSGSNMLSSAARAMNFASVAASGISTSMSTTPAQMSQAGIHNGTGVVSSNIIGSMPGLGITSSISSKSSISDGLDSDSPKADASKAPGYRANNAMSSPILRMQQQQSQVTPNLSSSNYNMDGPLTSQFPGVSGISTVTGSNTNSPHQSMLYNRGPNSVSMTHSQGFGHNIGPMGNQYSSTANHQDSLQGNMMGQQHMYQNNSGTVSGGVTVTSSALPTNVMSSRLNPRAPSFNLPNMPPKVTPTPQTQSSASNSSNMSSPYQSSQNQYSMHQHQQQQQQQQQQQYKNQMGMNNVPGMNTVPNQQSGYGTRNLNAGTGRQSGSSIPNWYANDIVDIQGLAALAAAAGGGAIDPQSFLGDLHDNQSKFSTDISNYMMKMEDRQLPRPIGSGRTWKSGNGGGGNVGGYSNMDSFDTGPLNQSMQTGGGNSQQQQAANWLGMYASNSGPSQNQFSSSNQPPIHSNVQHGGPGPGPQGRDRNFMGRRFNDDLDANRMLELQQQLYDGRMLNGGAVPPMMHMQNSGSHQQQQNMYPFGLEQPHMEQHGLPKVDQHTSWDQHLLMDDKHMGWGSKWGS